MSKIIANDYRWMPATYKYCRYEPKLDLYFNFTAIHEGGYAFNFYDTGVCEVTLYNNQIPVANYTIQGERPGVSIVNNGMSVKRPSWQQYSYLDDGNYKTSSSIFVADPFKLEPTPKCDCGAEKTYGNDLQSDWHSNWCSTRSSKV